MDAQDVTVQKHEGAARRVELLPDQQQQRLDAQDVGERAKGFLLVVGGDVGHERQVFHQAARFTLRRVRGAEHAPLRRLQRSRPGHLPGFLKLRRDPRHHPQGGYERQPGQHLRHALALHPEALHRPVPAADRVLQAVAQGILSNALDDVKLSGAVALAQDRVRLALQVRVEPFEAVLEQQRQQLTREFEPLVAVVVLIVNLRRVHHGVQNPPNHNRDVHALLPEIVRRHGHVRQHHARQDIPGLVHLAPLVPRVHHASRHANLASAVLQRLLLGEDGQRRALQQGRKQERRVRGVRPDHLHHLLVALAPHRLERHHDGNLVREGVVSEVELPVLDHYVRLGLALVRARRHARANLPFVVYVYDYPVLAELLLDQDHLLGPLDHEVSARVERALSEPRELLLRFPRQDAAAGPKHEGYPPDGHPPDAVLAGVRDDLLTPRVFHVHRDRRRVGHISQAALLRRDFLHDEVLLHRWLAHLDVGVLEVEVRVGVARDLLVRLGGDDLLDLLVDEVVERVDVLPDEASDLEERGEELELVLQGLDWSVQRRRVDLEAVGDPVGVVHAGLDLALIEGAHAHLDGGIGDAVVRHRASTNVPSPQIPEDALT